MNDSPFGEREQTERSSSRNSGRIVVPIDVGFDNATQSRNSIAAIFCRDRTLGCCRGQSCLVAALHCGVTCSEDGVRDRHDDRLAEMVGGDVINPMDVGSIDGAVGVDRSANAMMHSPQS